MASDSSSGGSSSTDTDELTMQHELDIIELHAAATSTPMTKGTVISDTFLDADGYLNSVDTANSSAGFDTDKYKRLGGGLYYYEFAADATDSINSADITINGSPTYSAGKVGNAVNTLVADSEYASGTISAADTIRTVDLWCKNDAANGEVFYIRKDVNNYLRIIVSATKIVVRMFKAAGEIWKLTSTTNVVNDTWIHVILIIGTGGAKLYINGDTTPEDTDASTVCMDSDFTEIGLFAAPAVPASCSWNGSLDNLFITTTQYTTAMVTFSYNSGAGRVLSASTCVIECDLPAVTGEVTATELIVNDIERETGDSITYEIEDTDTTTQSNLATDTQNDIASIDGTKMGTGKLRINLIGKATSPTDGYPSIRTYALKMWKA